MAGNDRGCRAIYESFSKKMLVVCMRYAQSRQEAEDFLQEGFIRVFQGLRQFQFEGSFEGWVRRTMINTAIEHYRKELKHHQNTNLEWVSHNEEPVSREDILSQLNAHDLLKMVQELSPQYRTVFNLYVFEGLKHKEIAQMLDISEGTSKSNLADARTILQRKAKCLMGIVDCNH